MTLKDALLKMLQYQAMLPCITENKGLFDGYKQSIEKVRQHS